MKVSVCIATHNGSKYIKEQIKSILIQLNIDDEIIISDDSSSDNTIEIIKAINDNRIKIFQNNTFFHHTFNFENAISKATGDYIFLSDQDDIWLQNKIYTMTHWLKNYNLVVSDCYIVDKDLNLIKDSIRKKNIKYEGFFRNLYQNNFLGCCMAFDRKIINYALPFPKNILSHESWLGAIAENFGNTKFIEDKLILFRRHNSNNSNTLNGSNLSFYKKIEYRYFILYNILKIKIKKYAN